MDEVYMHSKLDVMYHITDTKCIHHKDISPKPVNIKQGPKVKVDQIRSFPDHDFPLFGFTFQNSRNNNKGDTDTFKFGYYLFDVEL